MLDTDILTKLTLEEKILLTAGQDLWRTYSFEHAAVPYAKLTDGPNGARGGGSFVDPTPAALFPSPSCLAATFDVEAARSMGQCIAEDSLSKKCHVSLAPTVNMTRDQRYGRAFENYGEDPILTGAIGAHWTLGCQSTGVAATPKHFVANEAEADRRFSNSIVDEVTLRAVYLEPFRRIFKELSRAHKEGRDGEKGKVFEGKPACIMTAYNQLNGTSCSENSYTLIDVLRKEWAFDGVVMSDWLALHGHGLGTGCDLEMPGPTYRRQPSDIRAKIEANEITEADIDAAASRTLLLLQRLAPLGFSRSPADEDEQSIVDEGREAVIRRIAAEGSVLLKNEREILPLQLANIRKIALIGEPWVQPIQSGGGSANLTPQKEQSALDALTVALRAQSADLGHSIEVVHHTGCHLRNFPSPIKGDVLGSDGVVIEYFAGQTPPERSDDGAAKPLGTRKLPEAHLSPLVPADPKCEQNNFCLRVTADLIVPTPGTHTLGLICLGKARLRARNAAGKELLDWSYQGEDDAFEFFLNENKLSRRNTIDVAAAGERIQLTFDYTPAFQSGLSAALTSGASFRIGFDLQEDGDARVREAADLAGKADLALVLTGVGKSWESEGYDRPDLRLPCLQNELVEAVAQRQPQTVVINASGSAVEMPWLDRVKAVVQTWYGGQESAEAIVDVLLNRGEAPGSGRLCTTWPRTAGDQPGGESERNFPGVRNADRDGHPDVYYDEGELIGYKWYEAKGIEPLFWFGAGLGGFTTFERRLAKVSGSISRSRSGAGGEGLAGSPAQIEIDVEVQNTGKHTGKDVVQVYLSDVKKQGRQVANATGDAASSCPSSPVIKKLVAFAVVRLSPGESRTVRLGPLEADDFSRPLVIENNSAAAPRRGDWRVVAGRYDLILAKSADPADEIERREVVVEDSWVWRGLEAM
ncbi:unnamed protein product [Parajaminaea phylloscopi]